MNHQVVLLLTGCVQPNIKNDILAIKDVEIRKKQYLEAIDRYVKNTPYKIVFCENSGYDLKSEMTIRGGQIEYLSFVASSYGADRGKGYKEMEILEYIQAHSQFYREGDLFVKVTGRLILLNICQIIKHLDKYTCEFVSSYMYGRRVFSDSRFIFFTKGYFPLLLAQKDNITDWRHNFEYYTFVSVMEAKKLGIKFIYPPMFERVHGIGGGFGVSYDLSDKEYFKKNLRHQIKRLLFGLGVLPRVKW